MEVAKKKVKDLDGSWRESGKPNILHTTRSKVEKKPKTSIVPTSESLESETNLIPEEMKKLRVDFTQEMTTLQNRIVQMGRNQC